MELPLRMQTQGWDSSGITHGSSSCTAFLVKRLRRKTNVFDTRHRSSTLSFLTTT
jgi:hypothetical protein